MFSRAIRLNANNFQQKAFMKNLSRTFFSSSKLNQGPLLYTETHEWVQVNKDKNTAKMGISLYAADKLGEVTFVTLEEIDFDDEDALNLSAGDDMLEIESVKSSETIKMPIDGKIIKVNEIVLDEALICGRDPENSGWLTEIQIDDMDQVDKLMTKEQYEAFCQGDACDDK